MHPLRFSTWRSVVRCLSPARQQLPRLRARRKYLTEAQKAHSIHWFEPPYTKRPGKVDKFDPAGFEETIKAYLHKGGFHPTIIGDLFHHGRYQVLQKLGYSKYCTTWLANDRELARLVAIKIRAASSSEHAHNVEIPDLQRLASKETSHPGKNHVAQLLDHFSHKGPNGEHACLVLEFAGPVYTDELEKSYSSGRLPALWAWLLSKQLVQAVDWLHSNRIGHGAIRPGEFCMSAFPSYSHHVDLERLGRLPAREKQGMRLSASLDPSSPVPMYMTSSSLLPTPQTDYLSAKLLGFSHSLKELDIFGRSLVHKTPMKFRAPETIFEPDRTEYDLKLDIWGLGCTLWQLVTGGCPFLSRSYMSYNSEDHEGNIHREWFHSERDLAVDLMNNLGDLPEE